jgi:hypothetical protein
MIQVDTSAEVEGPTMGQAAWNQIRKCRQNSHPGNPGEDIREIGNCLDLPPHPNVYSILATIVRRIIRILKSENFGSRR